MDVSGVEGRIRGGWRAKGDKAVNQLMGRRGRGRTRDIPEKMRMVSIPERKLDSASSCGGLGVADLEGMGVMDLENPFSLWSFDSG